MTRRLVSILLLLLLGLMWVQPATAAEESEVKPGLVLEVYQLLKEFHISNPSAETLVDGAIQGMLDALDDYYTEYFDARELQGFTDSLNGDLVGIGVVLTAKGKYPVIQEVLPGTPAERGGLQRGDFILAVDGKSTADRPLTEVTMEIRGPRGVPVELTIGRGNEEFTVTLERAEVHVPSVDYEMLAGNTGYISVSTFGTHTPDEFESAISKLQDAGMDSLIIDLRGNGGGFLYEAVDMLGNFLPVNSVVVKTVDGRGIYNEIRTEKEPTITGLPIVVLVDFRTASASEIMAGALRDYELATVAGGTTYGKGTVQTLIPLSTGGALKITIAEYLTPKGTRINSVGLQPDHQVLTHSIQKEVAWQLLNPEDDPDLVFTAGGETLLNGRKVELDIKVIEKNNTVYFQLRPVLESMLYQVYWDNGKVYIMDGAEEKLALNTGGAGESNQIVFDNGNSYLAMDLFSRLNININKVGESYYVMRKI